MPALLNAASARPAGSLNSRGAVPLGWVAYLLRRDSQHAGQQDRHGRAERGTVEHVLPNEAPGALEYVINMEPGAHDAGQRRRINPVPRPMAAAAAVGHAMRAAGERQRGDGQRRVHGGIAEVAAPMLNRAVQQNREGQQSGGAVQPPRRRHRGRIGGRRRRRDRQPRFQRFQLRENGLQSTSLRFG